MRKLGRSRIDFAPLVVGGNVFGWTIDEKASINVLDAFIDQGFNAIATADVYSAWAAGNRVDESETIIGCWLKARPTLRDTACAQRRPSSRSHDRLGHLHIQQRTDPGEKGAMMKVPMTSATANALARTIGGCLDDVKAEAETVAGLRTKPQITWPRNSVGEYTTIAELMSGAAETNRRRSRFSHIRSCMSVA
jgi:hypothetical protein